MSSVIYHEKQESGLCGQHCVNALLQGPYYTPDSLASLAQGIDEAERALLDTDTLRNNLLSNNMNDAGWFSSQVLSKALEVWSLKLIPFGSPECEAERAHPEKELGFILNLDLHWYTLRRFGDIWMDLNSFLNAPVPITATYLGMLLQELMNQGYQIFCVKGVLPECDADVLAASGLLDIPSPSTPAIAAGTADECDWGLEFAIAQSLQDIQSPMQPPRDVEEMELSPEEMRRRRLERFSVG